MRFKNEKEMKKHISKVEQDSQDSVIDESESGFSDILKFMKKTDKGSGKITKKKSKKSSSQTRSVSNVILLCKTVN